MTKSEAGDSIETRDLLPTRHCAPHPRLATTREAIFREWRLTLQIPAGQSHYTSVSNIHPVTPGHLFMTRPPEIASRPGICPLEPGSASRNAVE